MKKLFLFLLTASILFLLSCNRSPNVEKMLENKATKDEVFSTIISDHDMMTEFMDQMMSDEHARMMMRGHRGMFGMMMDDGGMMKRLRDQPQMRTRMMDQMIQDGSAMSRMMQMMQEKGLMSEACLQSSMQMMKDKGMSTE